MHRVHVATCLQQSISEISVTAPSDFTAMHGNNLAGLCGFCCCVYSLDACGVGDIRRAAGAEGGPGRLFAGEIVLESLHPPAASSSVGA